MYIYEIFPIFVLSLPLNVNLLQLTVGYKKLSVSCNSCVVDVVVVAVVTVYVVITVAFSVGVGVAAVKDR